MPALVSIIVPCFNYGVLLQDALRSVQAQTMQNWECVIVDDGSTDCTEAISASALRADSRFTYIRQDNQGLASARNTGVCNSTAKFIQLLDADDLIEPHKLEAQVAYLEENPGVDLVYGAAKFFNGTEPESIGSSNAQMSERWEPRVCGTGMNLLKHIVRDNFMVVSAPLFRRTLVGKNGLFNASLTSHEDWDFWLRCALGGANFQFLEAEETRTLIRIHENSMSGNRVEMCKSNLVIRKQLARLLEGEQLKAINYERSLSLLLEATRTMAKSDTRSAWQFARNHWPLANGWAPALHGFAKFLWITLKTSRFGRSLTTAATPF